MVEAAVRPKIIYLARRRPELSSSEFIARWRQHGALAMAQPRWVNYARYIHCDVRKDVHVRGLREDYDAVGMLTLRSLAHYAARNQATSSHSIMVEDERATFDKLIGESRQVFQETQLVAGTRPNLKLIQFLWRSPTMSAAEFGSSWKDQERDRIRCVADVARGYAVNVPIPDVDPSGGLKCDAVEELWFEEPKSLKIAFERLRDQSRSWSYAVRELTAVATNEVVLFDRAAG